MNNKSWKYEIKNQVTGPAIITIYDDIGTQGISADAFVGDLKGIEGDLDVHINTKGGDVFDGIAIYNALSHRPGTVAITVDALAASIGSVIAMAASKGHLKMAKNATMMIHEGHAAIAGDSSDFAKMSDTLNKASDNIASIYADRTGKSTEYWREQMRNETWYSAQEAVAAGLADSILPGRPQNALQNADADGDNDNDTELGDGWYQRSDGSYRFDPDNDGDDDARPETDTDHGWWSEDGRLLKPIPPTPAPSGKSMTDVMPYQIVNVKKPYGDVPYADPGYLDADGKQVKDTGNEGVARYPVDESHVKAAWSYINQEKNASQYTSEQLAHIKTVIKKAMKQHGHDVADNEYITQIQATLKGVFE